MAQPGNEARLCRQRTFVEDYDLVLVRIPGQHVFRATIHHYRDPDIRSCIFDGTHSRCRQQDVADVAEFDNQNIAHAR